MASIARHLVLASKSISRRQILKDAGIPFDAIDANVDEAAIKQRGLSANISFDEIALSLAAAKAQRGLALHPDRFVLGCDQLLVCDGHIFDKPKTIDDARNHLKTFRNKTHTLISAMTLHHSQHPSWDVIDHATLTMRDISDVFLEDYLNSEGEKLLTSVGAYRLEGRGIQLFDDIVGNYFTILGLPLLPLLDELRRRGVIKT